MTPEEQIEYEAEWQHATMLGEVVWHRLATSRGLDPKDKAMLAARDEVVSLVRGAAFVIEREGFEGVARWLDDMRHLDPFPRMRQERDRTRPSGSGRRIDTPTHTRESRALGDV